MDTLLFLHIFNALFFKIMWEAIRVIRETNGRLRPRRDRCEYTAVVCDVKRFGFLCSSVFHVMFSSASPSERAVRYLLLRSLSSDALFPIVGPLDG